MVTNRSLRLWTNRRDWDSIAEEVDLRRRNRGASGHAGFCVLEDPEAAGRDEMLRCTRATAALHTPLGARIRHELDDLVEDNRGNATGRRALMLEGPSTAGKTTTTMLAVLRRSRAAWRDFGRHIEGYEQIPWVYVEVGSSYGYSDLAAAILTFCGLPVSPRDTAQSRIAYLREQLPKLGTEGIVVDDAHQLRASKSERLTDGIKNILTGLPVSFVFVGVDLTESALLKGANHAFGSSVQQIARRSTLLHCDLGGQESSRRSEWDRTLETLAMHVHLPSGEYPSDVLRDAALRDSVHSATGGLIGPTARLVRAAAVATVRREVGDFGAALRAQVAQASHLPVDLGHSGRPVGLRSVNRSRR